MTITARPPPSPPNDRREAIIETDIHDHRKPTYEAPPRNRHEASIDRQAPQTPIFSTLLDVRLTRFDGRGCYAAMPSPWRLNLAS